jgi:hypothetical protein
VYASYQAHWPPIEQNAPNLLKSMIEAHQKNDQDQKREFK